MYTIKLVNYSPTKPGNLFIAQACPWKFLFLLHIKFYCFLCFLFSVSFSFTARVNVLFEGNFLCISTFIRTLLKEGVIKVKKDSCNFHLLNNPRLPLSKERNCLTVVFLAFVAYSLSRILPILQKLNFSFLLLYSFNVIMFNSPSATFVEEIKK